jgi:hypothetical protein
MVLFPYINNFHLARQIYPGETKIFKEMFDLASSEKYGFLIFDLRQRSNNNQKNA